MKNSLLVFGTKNFNNSLSEIKEYLDFSLIFFNEDTPLDDTMSAISIILVDSEVCGDQKILSFINSINYRHPFPGPGLGIRIIGNISLEKIKILQEADYIYINELINDN